MEAAQASEGQLMITGAAGEQPLIMSAEDAAQFLAQAGLQLADIGDSERIIIGDAGQNAQELIEGNGTIPAELLAASGIEMGSEVTGEINDGTVLYIDPNDPQAQQLLQQAGLTLAEDGTVQAIDDVAAKIASFENGANASAEQEFFMAEQPQHQEEEDQQESVEGFGEEEETKELSNVAADIKPNLMRHTQLTETPIRAPRATFQEYRHSPAIVSRPKPAPVASPRTQTTTVPASSIQVGPDQQQVFYSVTGEDGKTQQYMMLCPKDMDQNSLIQTLVRQISSDPTSRGKKTIRITQQKKPPSHKPPRVTPVQKVASRPTKAAPASNTPSAPIVQAQRPPAPQRHQEVARKINEIVPAVEAASNSVTSFDESALMTSQENLLELPETGETRVFVRCNYCTSFRSVLNGDTWENILNHILPVCKEELQTTFYGDLGKHFIRSIRIQVNGKQIVRLQTPTGDHTMPQCEVILTHSLVCRKTKREFIIDRPDANFVANLAKHICVTQPGHGGRGNSLLCIFCNSPFTFEDYLRHIQPHIDAIIATLSCFAGAYCATSYDLLRAETTCITCQESEAPDLRFLPCSKFSAEYQCLTKLQFGIECFRENCTENGLMRLNTNHLSKCSVCKNPQQVYCAVFHITSTVLGMDELEGQQNIDSQLSVCINCQKQFINIVMKEQGFEEKMKHYQLRNMEQLCSCLRVILGQVKTICLEKKSMIYAVHENTCAANSTVHTVKGAEVSELMPITKLLAQSEIEIAASPVKAFYVCDLCMFTVDLTSLIATPSNRQKNDMLLSVVLEHVVPHTDSLTSVISNSGSGKTFSLKFEVTSNVTEIQNSGQRKIVLSLRKKFHSQLGNGAEVLIDKDDETTINAIRNAVKTDRKFPNRPAKPDAVDSSPAVTSALTASQQIEINKFIEKLRSKYSIWTQCGCNTTLLGSYIECRLCSKFCFPDFRLSSKGIEMCENCVETVLTLCLPSEPECLEIAEECLALKDEKNIGHRLVLASDLKKWLSLDGVNLIKKTVDEFERHPPSECSTTFSDGIRQHLLAALKTCQNDDDITTAVAGFCVNDDFFAAAAVKQTRERQIEVKILSRRPPPPVVAKKSPTPIKFGTKLVGANIKRIIKNGTVIDLGQASATAPGQAKIIYLNAANKKTVDDDSSQEESVSAIKSFLEETSPDKSLPTTTTFIDGREVRVPAGIKITSAGKGVVNIRAIADSRPAPGGKSLGKASQQSSTPNPDVTATIPAMVTVTSTGVINSAVEPDEAAADVGHEINEVEDMVLPEEAELVPLTEEPEAVAVTSPQPLQQPQEEPESTPQSVKRRGRQPKEKDNDEDFVPSASALKSSKPKIESLETSSAAENSLNKDTSLDDSTASLNSEEPRSKRARKEKKIFDL